jgi:heme-degrading monooxygenase HmoA
MFAVIFEVKPHADRHQEYLDTATALRPLLDEIDGFLSVDRFASRTRPGWLLSLSFWADEAALTAWRVRERHHLAQVNGRERVFADYRIRVAQVIADDEPGVAPRRPARRSAYNDPALRKPGYMGFLEAMSDPADADAEIMDSLYTTGKVICCRSWGDEAAAMTWRDRMLPDLSGGGAAARLRIVEVERDYGLFRRDQAPQYYPAVAAQPD